MKDLLAELATRPLCCDGGMGTQLFARGIKSGDCGMLWNVDRPEDILAVHQAYRQAGCELLTTNSFGGSACALERHGLAENVAALNLAAARLARQAAGSDAWVLGDVGPFGDFLEPYGDMTAAELRILFRAQIEALLEGGADAILVETMVDPAEATVGVQAARDASATVPVIVTFAFQKSAPGIFNTIMGTTPEQAVQQALAAGANVVGANCGTALTLDDYVELGAQLVAAAGPAPVIVQPNAGAPRTVGQDTVYDATPEQMAATARRLLETGVRIVGGCCGTTPAHLAAMAPAIRRGP